MVLFQGNAGHVKTSSNVTPSFHFLEGENNLFFPKKKVFEKYCCSLNFWHMWSWAFVVGRFSITNSISLLVIIQIFYFFSDSDFIYLSSLFFLGESN